MVIELATIATWLYGPIGIGVFGGVEVSTFGMPVLLRSSTPCGSLLPCASMHSTSSYGAPVHIDKDLVAASAAPLDLAILAEGESYGYAILKRVRALSGGRPRVDDGMLYPLLHRLQRLGYVTTEWRTPPEGRRRKYYAITDEGRATLADQQQHGWPLRAR